MKTVISMMMLLVSVLVLPHGIFADECLEGDCDNGSGKGFTEEGQIYEGEWLSGEPHGHGRLYVSKGKILEGRWVNGKLLEANEQKQILNEE